MDYAVRALRRSYDLLNQPVLLRALLVEAVATSRPHLAAIPLISPPLRWTVSAVAPPAGQTSPAARALLAQLTEALPAPVLVTPS